jgi:hypothetical protein
MKLLDKMQSRKMLVLIIGVFLYIIDPQAFGSWQIVFLMAVYVGGTMIQNVVEIITGQRSQNATLENIEVPQNAIPSGKVKRGR